MPTANAEELLNTGRRRVAADLKALNDASHWDGSDGRLFHKRGPPSLFDKRGVQASAFAVGMLRRKVGRRSTIPWHLSQSVQFPCQTAHRIPLNCTEGTYERMLRDMRSSITHELTHTMNDKLSLGWAFDRVPDTSFTKHLGACRRRTPKSAADLKGLEDASHRDLRMQPFSPPQASIFGMLRRRRKTREEKKDPRSSDVRQSSYGAWWREGTAIMMPKAFNL